MSETQEMTVCPVCQKETIEDNICTNPECPVYGLNIMDLQKDKQRVLADAKDALVILGSLARDNHNTVQIVNRMEGFFSEGMQTLEMAFNTLVRALLEKKILTPEELEATEKALVEEMNERMKQIEQLKSEVATSDEPVAE